MLNKQPNQISLAHNKSEMNRQLIKTEGNLRDIDKNIKVTIKY
jgi:hypothetical protein